MRIQARKAASVTVLDLDGRLTAGRGAACLTETVDTLLGQGFAKIILNMEHVDLADCAGIGQLVNCYCKTQKQGGGLKLVHVDRRLGDLLRLFRLESLLEVFETERAALASLAAGYVRVSDHHVGPSRPGVNRLAGLISMTQSLTVSALEMAATPLEREDV